MIFILSLYDHNVVIHMKVCQGTLSNRGVIAILLLEFNNLLNPQP